jgi:hypothetical protein
MQAMRRLPCNSGTQTVFGHSAGCKSDSGVAAVVPAATSLCSRWQAMTCMMGWGRQLTSSWHTPSAGA